MVTKLVPIGNSKGIRLPKAILQASGLEDSIDVRVEEGKLIITAARRPRKPRKGWAEAIRAELKRNGRPDPIDPEWESLPNSWDAEGWR